MISNGSKFLEQVRHIFNPLHVYCRLTSLGISNRLARKICRTYETCLYKPTIGPRS